MPINCPTVAHIVSSFLPLTQNWLYNQIRFLNGWRPIVLCQRTENLGQFPFDDLFPLKSLPKPFSTARSLYTNQFGYFPDYWWITRKEKAKLFHAHFGTVGYRSLKLANQTRLPLITTFYGFDISRRPNEDIEWVSRYKRLFRQGQLFLIEGSNMRQQLIELGCPPDKALIHHLGVDLSKLPFKIRRIEDDGVVRILSAATFTEKKGLIYAIEAFGRLANIHKNVRMTIIGDARDRSDEQITKRKLHEMVSKYNIEEKVIFIGYQPYYKLVEQLYDHHIFLAPSVQAVDGDNEGGVPVSIIEATASGMPVISTYHCDIPEVIKDGHSGFLVPERDPSAIVERLEHLIHRPEIWSEMGLNGRHHVKDHYNVIAQSEKLENIYQELVN